MKNLQKHLVQLQQLHIVEEHKHNIIIKAARPASISIKTVKTNLYPSLP
jgi:hypothetical protein